MVPWGSANGHLSYVVCRVVHALDGAVLHEFTTRRVDSLCWISRAGRGDTMWNTTPARPGDGMLGAPYSSLKATCLPVRLSNLASQKAVDDRVHLQESDGCMTERNIHPQKKPQFIR